VVFFGSTPCLDGITARCCSRTQHDRYARAGGHPRFPCCSSRSTASSWLSARHLLPPWGLPGVLPGLSSPDFVVGRRPGWRQAEWRQRRPRPLVLVAQQHLDNFKQSLLVVAGGHQHLVS